MNFSEYKMEDVVKAVLNKEPLTSSEIIETILDKFFVSEKRKKSLTKSINACIWALVKKKQVVPIPHQEGRCIYKYALK